MSEYHINEQADGENNYRDGKVDLGETTDKVYVVDKGEPAEKVGTEEKVSTADKDKVSQVEQVEVDNTKDHKEYNYEDSFSEDGSEDDYYIEDDGEESSEHSSIDLEEYLKNRDNIPSDPSDCNKDYEDEEEDEDYEDESSSSVPQKKTRKDTARDKKRVKNEAKGKQGKGGNAPRKARK